MMKVPIQKPSWLRKGLPSAIDVFLEESCPQLGGTLTREPVVREIMKLVDEYLPSTERMRQGQVLWYAVDENETSGYGKKIEKCKTVKRQLKWRLTTIRVACQSRLPVAA